MGKLISGRPSSHSQRTGTERSVAEQNGGDGDEKEM